MWRYWTFLTDLPQSQIDSMQASVASGELHPMQAKKNLAHSITTDFHSPTEADAAAESWATQFQQKGIAEDVEEMEVPLEEIESDVYKVIRLPKLLVKLGLASSNAEANRKITEGAVSIDAVKIPGSAYDLLDHFALFQPPFTLTVRLGKKAKRARIVMTNEAFEERRKDLPKP